MKFNTFNLLDCTLRDGGYYNNWEFSKKNYKSYLEFIKTSKIKYLEIGFRFFKKNYFMGPFAYSSENFLKQLKISKKIKIAIMFNANELINGLKNKIIKLSEILPPKKNSCVSVVRIATQLDQLSKIISISKKIKKLGYLVCLNVMRADQLDEVKLEQIIDVLKKNKAIDILYLADSFGSMVPTEVYYKISYLKKKLSIPIGIHTHDNCKLALKNSMAAVDGGATFIDSTILGMGRGSGNTKTEDLIKKLIANKQNYSTNQLSSVLKNFKELKKKFKWGHSKSYEMAAKNKIHPTYVQVLETEFNKTKDETIKILNDFKKNDLSAFNLQNLKNIKYKKHNLSVFKVRNFLKKKEVLILGKGPILNHYKNDFTNFIEKKNLCVMSLNYNSAIDSKLIDYYLLSNTERILTDLKKINLKKNKIILPLDRLKATFPKLNITNNFYNYPINISQKKMVIDDKFCQLKSSDILFYALALCKIGNCKKIYLAGIDGFNFNDPRYVEISNHLRDFLKLLPNNFIKSLTPSSYDFPKGSFYELY